MTSAQYVGMDVHKEIGPGSSHAGNVNGGFFPPARGNNEARGVAAQERVTALRVRHRAVARRRIRRANAGRRWFCRPARNGMTKSYRT